MRQRMPSRSSANRPRRRRSLLSSLLLAATALLAALALAEIAARVLVPDRKWLHGHDEQAAATAGVLQPDLDLGHLPVLDGKTYDEHGLLREQSLAAGAAKQAGVERVLFLGDSVTARSRIVEPLRRACSGNAVEMLNAGIEAANPVQSVEVYMRHQRQLAPDHVILSLHNNDFTSTRVCLRGDDGSLLLCVQGKNLPFDGGLYDASALYRLWVGARCRELNKGDGYLHCAGAVADAVRTLRDETAARGAKLTVLLLPIFAPLEQWQAHEVASRDLALTMLRDLDVETIDLLPALRELLAAGEDVVQTPGDTWHPGTRCGEHLAAAAVQAGLFGPRENARVAAASAPQRLATAR